MQRKNTENTNWIVQINKNIITHKQMTCQS